MYFQAVKFASQVNFSRRVIRAFNIIKNNPSVLPERCNSMKTLHPDRFPMLKKLTACRYYSHQDRICWKCGSSIDRKDLFCRKCEVLQTVDQNSNYFNILGLEENYDLEPSELSTNFRNLQRNLHPDRFVNKDEEERRISAEYSSLVNKAYTTLLNPLNRGIYMLKLRGIIIEEGTAKMSPEFLMDIMERNEEVDGLKDESEIKRLTKVYQEILQNLSRDVGKQIKEGALEKAKESLLKMKYFSNIDSKLKELRHTFGISD